MKLEVSNNGHAAVSILYISQPRSTMLTVLPEVSKHSGTDELEDGVGTIEPVKDMAGAAEELGACEPLGVGCSANVDWPPPHWQHNEEAANVPGTSSPVHSTAPALCAVYH